MGIARPTGLVPLLALLLSAPLQAEQWCVINEGGRRVPDALLEEAFGGPTRDVGRQFHVLDMLAPLPLGDLDALPPEGLFDAAFQARWLEETAACKARTSPPYGRKNRLAYLCGVTAAQTLWQTWLERSGCAGLFRFGRSVGQGVSAFSWYRTDSDALHEIKLNTSGDDAEFLDAVRKARSASATGFREMGRRGAPPSASPGREPRAPAAKLGEIPALPPTGACKPLPALTFTGVDASLAALAGDLWSRSTPQPEGALSCRIEVLEQALPAMLKASDDSDLPMGNFVFVLVEVDCSGFRVKADHRTVGGNLGEPRTQQAIAKKIVLGLQKKLCP